MIWQTVFRAGCIFITHPLKDGEMMKGPFVRYFPGSGHMVVVLYEGQLPPTGLEEWRLPRWFTLA